MRSYKCRYGNTLGCGVLVRHLIRDLKLKIAPNGSVVPEYAISLSQKISSRGQATISPHSGSI